MSIGRKAWNWFLLSIPFLISIMSLLAHHRTIRMGVWDGFLAGALLIIGIEGIKKYTGKV